MYDAEEERQVLPVECLLWTDIDFKNWYVSD